MFLAESFRLRGSLLVDRWRPEQWLSIAIFIITFYQMFRFWSGCCELESSFEWDFIVFFISLHARQLCLKTWVWCLISKCYWWNR